MKDLFKFIFNKDYCVKNKFIFNRNLSKKKIFKIILFIIMFIICYAFLWIIGSFIENNLLIFLEEIDSNCFCN